jgi:very-short-patch-repair endonuclease
MKISELTIKQFKTNLKLFSNQKYLTSTKEEIICQVDEYEKPLLSQFARELFNFDTDYHNLNFELEKCESPIEQMMLLALFAIGEEELGDVSFEKKREMWKQPDLLIILPQEVISEYRIDFAIIHREFFPTGYSDRFVLVECDGHEYHEKTKEQARKDKSRDRKLQSDGYKVLRFTGSEIFENPFACAQEVLKTLSNTRRLDLKHNLTLSSFLTKCEKIKRDLKLAEQENNSAEQIKLMSEYLALQRKAAQSTE